MKQENICRVSVGEREMRKAATNGGLPIDLSPGTSKVIFCLVPEGPEKTSTSVSSVGSGTASPEGQTVEEEPTHAGA